MSTSATTPDGTDARAEAHGARLRDRIVADVVTVDGPWVRALLGTGTDGALGLDHDGREVFPLFQFDVAGRRILPGMSDLLRHRPSTWSDWRLLQWLTSPNPWLGGPPCEGLRDHASDVLAVLVADAEPPTQG